ncbi:MAG: protein kinase [Polyangia bacterium]
MTMSRELSGKVAGNFRLGEPLSRGGASTVYAAEQTDTGRPAAVRVFAVDLSRDKAAAAKLVSEVTRLTAIRHPNLVPVLDVGTVENKGKKFLFIAMERLHGESLKARLGAQAGKALPLHVALQITSDVGGALQAIHRAGQVHQRVSAGAVFLAAPSDEDRRADPEAEDRVILLDVGTAAVAAAGNGEPGKASKPPRSQDDVRALALLTQEMLGGVGEPAAGEQPLLPLRVHNRKVPARIDAVLRTALGEPAFAEHGRSEASRSERIDSVAALVAALVGAPDSTPTLGAWSADGRAAMPRPRTGTNWLWAGGLALVGGLGVGYWLYHTEPPLPTGAVPDLASLATPALVTPAADLGAAPTDLSTAAAPTPTPNPPGVVPGVAPGGKGRDPAKLPPLRDADPTGPAAAPAGPAAPGAKPAAPATPAAAPAPAANRTTTAPAPSGSPPGPAGTPTRANEVK